MTALTGTEKQIAYAEEVKTRLLEKISIAIKEVEEFINTERSLSASEEDIKTAIRNRSFGDLRFISAFSLAKKEVPFTTPEKYIELLVLSKKYLESLKSAKEVLDKATPESTTFFLSHFVRIANFVSAK